MKVYFKAYSLVKQFHILLLPLGGGGDNKANNFLAEFPFNHNAKVLTKIFGNEA